jgi:hypothetical protein
VYSLHFCKTGKRKGLKCKNSCIGSKGSLDSSLATSMIVMTRCQIEWDA